MAQVKVDPVTGKDEDESTKFDERFELTFCTIPSPVDHSICTDSKENDEYELEKCNTDISGILITRQAS